MDLRIDCGRHDEEGRTKMKWSASSLIYILEDPVTYNVGEVIYQTANVETLNFINL